MNDKIINKFENEKRIAELNPKNTLIKAGFKENMILCDIGAGTGVFSFPATMISDNNIYALDISDNMIKILSDKKSEQNIKNLIIKKVESDILPIENDSCNMAIMVTVLHELENKQAMLKEIKRVLKSKGRLMIIEFHKIETKMGPPINHRLAEDDVEEICSSNGFKMLDKFSLGNNLYSIVFEV